MTCSTTPPPPADGADALDAVAARLRRAGVLDLLTGTDRGTGWQSLPRAVEQLVGWHADLTRDHGDRRAAAAYLAAWVAGTPALVVGLPAIVGNLTVEVEAASIHVHRHPQGFIDRRAIVPTHVRTGPDEVVLAQAADRVAHLTAPLVERLSDELPVGPVALWGGIADVVAAYALWFARRSGGDQRLAWSSSEMLLDRLAQVAPVRYRPRLVPVAWSGGTSYFPVRSTCCLYYRTDSAAGAEGPTYCATCPLRCDETRTARLVGHLEATS